MDKLIEALKKEKERGLFYSLTYYNQFDYFTLFSVKNGCHFETNGLPSFENKPEDIEAAIKWMGEGYRDETRNQSD